MDIKKKIEENEELKDYADFVEGISSYIKAHEKERELPDGWEFTMAKFLLKKYGEKTGQDAHIVLIENMDAPNLFDGYF